MGTVETNALTLEQLVDQLADWDKLANDAKAQIAKIQAAIQERALSEMKERKVKTVQYYGSNKNYVLVTMARKVEVLNYSALLELFTDQLIANHVSKEVKTSYSLKKDFKEIASAAFFGETIQDSVQYVLKEMGMEDSQVTLALKKLKGDYEKDKNLLRSMGFGGEEVEGWIFLLHQAMTFQKMKDALKAANREIDEDSVEQIKKAVYVEETPKITVKYA